MFRKKSTARHTFNSHVIDALLKHKESDITAVNDLSDAADGHFDRARYPEILALLKRGNIADVRKSIEKAPPVDKDHTFREFIIVMKFYDAVNSAYFVTIYDSTELWQNPEVIDVVKLHPQPPPSNV